MTDALARCCTKCMVSWESCAMLTRWRSCLLRLPAPSELLLRAPLRYATRWTRPCNGSSQLREIEVSIGANKEKKSLFAKHTSSNSISTFT